MKFKRKFTSKTLETEDTDYWATILASLDLQEYSIDHREKRRHCALDVFNLDGALFPSNGDVLRGIFKSENDKRSDSAITKLKTHQQKLTHIITHTIYLSYPVKNGCREMLNICVSFFLGLE